MFVGGHHTSEFNLDLQTGLLPNQNTVKCKDVRLLHSAEDGFSLEGQWCVLSEPPRKSEPCSEFAQASLFRRGWCEASAAALSSIWFFDSWSWLLNHIFFPNRIWLLLSKMCLSRVVFLFVSSGFMSPLRKTRFFTSTVLKYRSPVEKIQHFFLIYFHS